MTKRIERLVDDVTHRKIRAPYLDELQARAAGRQGRGGVEGVQQEILREMADSYSRSQRRVDAAFERLARLADELGKLERGAPPAVHCTATELTVAFNDQRELAAQRLWELRVHRDALGFAHSDELGSKYPLPPRRVLPSSDGELRRR
ncbi:MAG: hypothetical protein JRI23_21575 [Deltaproteobacteria bacterium]|nr:hypothetical protein [Deltaproteobacteria bacterium]MBW2534533.1 hypothetical protein [Deltaproteobacteria bacterium]